MKPGAKAFVVITLCLTALPCLRTNALAQEAPRPIVVVHVYNNAEAAQPMLAEAGLYVREIFENIGVAVLWLDSQLRIQARGEELLENQWSGRDNFHVSVVIVSKPIPGTHFNFGSRVLGFTPLGGGADTRCYVFYDRVEAFVDANQRRVPHLRIPRLLAHAVAHEMGHLLIGKGDTHSPSGIMRARLTLEQLDRAARGQLLFTDEDGQWINKEIRRRAHLTGFPVTDPTVR